MRTMPATRFLQSSPSSEPSLLSNPFYIGVVLFFAVITFLSVMALVLALSWRCLRGKVTDLINKAAIKSLPILPFSDVAKQKNNNTGCVICLAEFKKGERVRVLPQCDHAFHVGCIDKWLVSHLTCPTCRETVVVPRCI